MTAAAAATELLGRVQASLTAGYNASAAHWPASAAPVMTLPASSGGLQLTAPAATKLPNLPTTVVSVDPSQQTMAIEGKQQVQAGLPCGKAASPAAVHVVSSAARKPLPTAELR